MSVDLFPEAINSKSKIPSWVRRGKTITQLISELSSFEKQEVEVRISLDGGETHHPISLVEKHGKFCVLVNSESYYSGPWRAFKKKIASTKTRTRSANKKNA